MAEPTARRDDLKRMALVAVPIVIGLVASTILLVDYSRPAPVFCQADGGCGAVKRTMYATFLGVMTPAWGVAGFASLATLSVMRGRVARALFAGAASIGALAAAALIAVQITMHTFCPYCLAVDSSTLIVCAIALHRFRAGWDPLQSIGRRAIAGTGYAAAFAVPCVAGFALPIPVPGPIAAEMAKTPQGKVTIVDFVDFECPFCRDTNAELEAVVSAHADRVRVVRKQVPLPRLHPHAVEAARAACCGEEMGKGDEVAASLFSTPPEELTTDGCVTLATRVGLDPARFRACLHDDRTTARIKAESEAFFKEVHGHGLPTIFIDGNRLEGAQDRATLEEAVRRALGG